MLRDVEALGLPRLVRGEAEGDEAEEVGAHTCVPGPKHNAAGVGLDEGRQPRDGVMIGVVARLDDLPHFTDQAHQGANAGDRDRHIHGILPKGRDVAERRVAVHSQA